MARTTRNRAALCPAALGHLCPARAKGGEGGRGGRRSGRRTGEAGNGDAKELLQQALQEGRGEKDGGVGGGEAGKKRKRWSVYACFRKVHSEPPGVWRERARSTGRDRHRQEETARLGPVAPRPSPLRSSRRTQPRPRSELRLIAAASTVRRAAEEREKGGRASRQHKKLEAVQSLPPLC